MYVFPFVFLTQSKASTLGLDVTHAGIKQTASPTRQQVDSGQGSCSCQGGWWWYPRGYRGIRGAQAA